jgi:hypothetical protein
MSLIAETINRNLRAAYAVLIADGNKYLLIAIITKRNEISTKGIVSSKIKTATVYMCWDKRARD